MRGISSSADASGEISIEGGGGGGGGMDGVYGGGGGEGANGSAGPPPPFLSKTYDMVDDPATDEIVSWGPGNNSFVVWNTPEFARDLLPKYFKHSNFSSFVRQLNTYGFRKVDPDRWEFANEGFLRGQKHLLKTINRRKPSHVHSQPQQPQAQNSTVAACVEVGKFGLEEEIERLKRDKNVLMQELVRLRQQQQATDHQLQNLGQHFQGMEQRQQQMMSFLAKAMQNPGFLAKLVQQNDSTRRITVVNKKRRFPKQGNELDGESSSPNGQIIKYQPLMNEAAKAMLMQILKFDTSPRLESLSNSESLMIENFPSPMEATGSSSSSNWNSGVTLKEVPPSSGTPYLTARSGFSALPSSSALSEMQSSAGVADMATTAGGVTEAVDRCLTGMSISGYPQVEEIVPNGNTVNVPIENYAVPGAENEYINPISTEMEDFDTDTGIGISIDDDDQGLPGIDDAFWEQFLSASPISGEEADWGMQEAKEMPENGWDSDQKMEHLTEQMGLLSPETKQ